MAETEKEVGHFRTAGGMVIQFDLPLAEVYADQVTRAQLRRVNEDGTDYVDHSEGSDLTNGKPPRPAQSASKAEWVGYAVLVHEVPVDDADAMTKTDLIEKYGKD